MVSINCSSSNAGIACTRYRRLRGAPLPTPDMSSSKRIAPPEFEFSPDFLFGSPYGLPAGLPLDLNLKDG